KVYSSDFPAGLTSPVLSVLQRSVVEARHSSRFSATQGTSISRRFITASGWLQKTSMLAFRWNPSSAKTRKISATIDQRRFPLHRKRESRHHVSGQKLSLLIAPVCKNKPISARALTNRRNLQIQAIYPDKLC